MVIIVHVTILYFLNFGLHRILSFSVYIWLSWLKKIN